MELKHTTKNWLKTLLDSRKQALPYSTIPKSAVNNVSYLILMGFLSRERSGAGEVVSVVNKDAIANLLKASGNIDNIELESLPKKTRAVAMHGDAHKGGAETRKILLMAGCGVLRSESGVLLDVSECTKRYGIAALAVDYEDCSRQWRSDSPVGLVENLNLLMNAELYMKATGFNGVLLYYAGQIPANLINWMNRTKLSDRYTVFPDYDWVGLSNALRISLSLHGDVSIHTPDNLIELMQKYGNRDRIVRQKQSAPKDGYPLRKIRSASKIYDAIMITGNGLDQESLLIDTLDGRSATIPHVERE